MKKIIGVLITGIQDDFNINLLHGISLAAEECDVNIVVFPGKYYNRQFSENDEYRYEYQYEAIFEYARVPAVDGLIIPSGTIGCLTTREVTEEFVKSYNDKPCVLVADEMEGYPSVRYDGISGLKDGLMYLTDKLGCTKIGMLGGAYDNNEVQERKACYEEILTSRGIELVESRYAAGLLAMNDRAFYADYLDKNPDLEAIFCVNDHVAMELYDELKDRGIEPGRDISILGYDDLPLSSQIYPTLSSVRADASKLGEKAVHMMVDILNGKDVENIFLPTEFIRRKSFVRLKGENDIAQEVVMRQNVDMNNMLNDMRERHAKSNYALKHFIRQVLSFERGDDTSYEEVLGTLDWLEIKNAYIYMYDNPVIHMYRAKLKLPSYVSLKATLIRNKVHGVPAIRQHINHDKWLHADILKQRDRFTFVLLPLFSNEVFYGVLLCDLTEHLFENGDFLSNMLSSAVKMIYLLRNNEDVRMKLEHSIFILNENNIALDTLSKSDPLTGILNRRGFFDAAENLLLSCRNAKQSMIVLYVDMNNLKIINDRYGHENGDFSLITIGDMLVRTERGMQGEGIVGRIGGDEFACAFACEESEKAIVDRIYALFDEFNKECDKPYNVTVSVGSYMIEPDDARSLSDCLTMADEQLYEVKKLRKKEVDKDL